MQIGTFKGRSACILAKILQEISPSTKLFLFDPLDGKISQNSADGNGIDAVVVEDGMISVYATTLRFANQNLIN